MAPAGIRRAGSSPGAVFGGGAVTRDPVRASGEHTCPTPPSVSGADLPSVPRGVQIPVVWLSRAISPRLDSTRLVWHPVSLRNTQVTFLGCPAQPCYLEGPVHMQRWWLSLGSSGTLFQISPAFPSSMLWGTDLGSAPTLLLAANLLQPRPQELDLFQFQVVLS